MGDSRYVFSSIGVSFVGNGLCIIHGIGNGIYVSSFCGSGILHSGNVSGQLLNGLR